MGRMRTSQVMLVLVAVILLSILFSSDGGRGNSHDQIAQIKDPKSTEKVQNEKILELHGFVSSLRRTEIKQRVENESNENKKENDATTRLGISSIPKEIGNKPRHVMFSYKFKRKANPNRLEEVISYNSRVSTLELARTVVLYMDDWNRAIGKNQHGYPVLRDMFIHARMVVPDADTYTYFNADLIFNKSFVETMDALVYAARQDKINSKFFAVGSRMSIEWNENMIVGQSIEDMESWYFERVFKSGERLEEDREDYFTVSPNIWDWNTIPRFVIGRNKYDNYLVQRAVLSDDNITTINVSDTLGVIHQSKPDSTRTNYFGGQRLSHEDINSTINSDVSRHVSIEECRYVSYWDSSGQLQIRPRNEQ